MKTLVILSFLVSQAFLALASSQPVVMLNSTAVNAYLTSETNALEKPEAVQYTYLCATNHHLTYGETFAISTVVAVPINAQGLQREEIIEKFAEKLQDSYPDRTFDISVECIRGSFASLEEAEAERRVVLMKCEDASNIYATQVELSLR